MKDSSLVSTPKGRGRGFRFGLENEEYYQDEKSNLLYLVTREVFVLNKNFGGYNEANLVEAEKYSLENNFNSKLKLAFIKMRLRY